MPELTTEKSVLLTDLALCVNRYRLFTPGIYDCLHVPVLLDENTSIVPGLIAMVNHGRLKQCEPVTLGFEGPPNFVLDVFDLPRFHPYSFYSSGRDNVGQSETPPAIPDAVTTFYGSAWQNPDVPVVVDGGG